MANRILDGEQFECDFRAMQMQCPCIRRHMHFGLDPLCPKPTPSLQEHSMQPVSIVCELLRYYLVQLLHQSRLSKAGENFFLVDGHFWAG